MLFFKISYFFRCSDFDLVAGKSKTQKKAELKEKRAEKSGSAFLTK